jgi:pyruvate formate lyase activating enzyme
VGGDMSVDEVMKEVRADADFYATSGGGITLSGGEPLCQLEFSLALLKLSREAGIHTCIETSGHIASHLFKQVFPLTDLLLFDYKVTDAHLHKLYTGVSNELILHNLSVAHSAGVQIILRCPIIPGINDNEDHFRGIQSIEEKYPRLVGIELMPYHNMGSAKSESIGRAKQTQQWKPADQKTKERWIRKLIDLGCIKIKIG